MGGGGGAGGGTTGMGEGATGDPMPSVPPELAQALSLAKHRKAKAFFETLDSANRYAVCWRVQTAKKPETRARRVETLVAMLMRGEKLH